MKKIFILMVCLVAIAFAAEMIPAHIPGSAIHKDVLPATIEIKAECVYTGITNYPPWLEHGRDAPWDTDVHIDDVYGTDDAITSMAIDATGRIYICYEALTTGGDYRWGIATSIDNGQNWDNRAYGISGQDFRYPEIAISDDGRIYIFGSRTGAGYTDNASFTKSPLGAYNDPDGITSIWTFGGLPNRTFPECVSWGDGDEFVCAQYTVDRSGSNDSVCVIFSHDSLGAAYDFTFQPTLGNPEKTSISVDVVGNDTIFIHGIEYYDAAGSDWDVVCYLDTLNGSGGLYG